MNDIFAALEIGTSRTVLAVGESTNEGRVKVIAKASIPSTRVRKSQILDIDQATRTIRGVLREIEKAQSGIGNSIDIGNAFLVVSGQHIKADTFTGSVQISGAKVSDADIEEVSTAVRTMPIPKDRELLDIAELSYKVDNRGGITDPRGMSGSILSLNTIHIHADASRINDARTAAGNAHLDISDPLFATTCAAEAVLSEDDKREGALVLDLGGGSTGFAVYEAGSLAHTGVIGVGGDHVTNDIATAFQTTQAQAETLKVNHACAMVGGNRSGEPRIKLPGSSAIMDSHTISRQALDTVVNARLKELFHIIRQNLEDVGLLHSPHAGAFITGGGAAMSGIDTLIQRELGMSVKRGIPVNVDGLDGVKHAEAFAAVSGALLYGFASREDKPNILQKIFGGLFRK